jgi:CDP-glycerol glycerophosphotransferase (TagB/SpsB family)
MNVKIDNFIARWKYVKLGDILAIFPFLIAIVPSKIYRVRHPDLWLICEERDEARDNGYWFYKYVKEKHSEIDAAYAINKASPDYRKVRILGNVIQYGSLLHWIYYLAASKNISSQKGGKPNAALCYVLEIYGIIKNKRIFLQHGITLSDCKWLYYDVCKFSLFVCAAKAEYDYVTEKFGYKNRDVTKLAGFCRYDNLDIKKEKVKRQLLIMPTWRSWLARSVNYDRHKNDFIQTNYFIKWNSLIHNDVFQHSLEIKNITMVFFLHRNMQKFLDQFEASCANIILADWRRYDIQTLLNESAFLITDYSSISMDFAYMKKPLVYYQFDREEFRKKQYQEGYFSYENAGFGEVITTENELVSIVKKYIDNDCTLDKIYEERIDDFFAFNDADNCKRNFELVNAI